MSRRTTALLVALGATTLSTGLFAAVASAHVWPGCTRGDFPQVYSFRIKQHEVTSQANAWPLTGRVMTFATDFSDTFFEDAFDVTDLECIEYLHDRDPAYVVEAEGISPDAETIWHASFGVVMPSELTSDASEVKVPGGTNVPVFAGHWLFEVGDVAVDFVEESVVTDEDGDTVDSLEVEVGDASPFAAGDWVMLHYVQGGVHDWSNFVHGEVHEVDGSTLVLVSTKGTLTEATGDLWVQPHAWIWAPNQWVVNLANIEQDGQSRYGWEFFADVMEDRHWNGVLQSSGGPIDGMEFDGGRWRNAGSAFSNHPDDADNDGVADNGYVDGAQAWGLGGVCFADELRQRLGPDVLLMADSSVPGWGFRGYGQLNGAEMENFPEAAVGWSASLTEDEKLASFGGQFIHLRQWVDEVDHDPLSYAKTKEVTAEFGCPDGTWMDDDEDVFDTADPADLATIVYGSDNRWFRIGLASDLLVGMPHPYTAEDSDSEKKCFNLYVWDEYIGGTLNDWDWLGQPTGSALQVTDQLVPAPSLSAFAEDASTCLDGEANASASQLHFDVIEACNDPASGDLPDVDDLAMAASTPGLPSASGFTVSFQADATIHYPENPLIADCDGGGAAIVPRQLRVTLSMVSGEEYAQDVLVPVGAGWVPYELSFLTPPGDRLAELRFASGEDAGTLVVDDPTLELGSADRWVRYFDGGAVLLNMTPDAWTYSLDGASSSTGYERLTALNNTDADGVNTGAPGGGLNQLEFTVPALDALIVRVR